MYVPLQRAFAKVFHNAQFNILPPLLETNPRHLVATLSFLATPPKSLIRLCVEPMAIDFFDRPQSELDTLRSTLASLVQMKLRFEMPQVPSEEQIDEVDKTFHGGRLARFIWSARNLQLLDLDFPAFLDPDLHYVLGPNT